jgi:hypothetical protein
MRNLAVLLLTACATTPTPAAKGGPRGLRADEHIVVAREHQLQADQETRWPDRRGNDPFAPDLTWTRSWDPDADHARAAAIHRSRADELHAAYSEACGDRPLEQASISPLRRFGTGGWNTQTGVIVYLDSAAGPPERLLADVKCHRAWMMLTSNVGMEDCPLDLPGITVDARGDRDGITVSIGIRDRKLVGELQRRTAKDLELGAPAR